jgi:hypothetical protein
MICNKCGAIVENNIGFCPSCGTGLSAAGPSESAARSVSEGAGPLIPAARQSHTGRITGCVVLFSIVCLGASWIVAPPDHAATSSVATPTAPVAAPTAQVAAPTAPSVGEAATLPAFSPGTLLPAGGMLVEYADVTAATGKPRGLILWMENPSRVEIAPGEYTCRDRTRGSHFTGPTRLSLVDLEGRQVINTIALRTPGGDADSFDIPYRIQPGYYSVPAIEGNNEGKPTLLDLKDWNGDGHAAEFVIFAAEACDVVSTAMLGYSFATDRAVQFPIEYLGNDGQPKQAAWIEQAFAHEPVRPGHWSFSRNHGDGSDQSVAEKVDWDASRELFVLSR